MSDNAISICGPGRTAKAPSEHGELLRDVSIVIPVGPGDHSWRSLLPDLAIVSPRAEILLVATEPEPSDLQECVRFHAVQGSVQWIVSPMGRARQLNHGASCARRAKLWFLHADSRIELAAIRVLDEKIAEDATVLYFFDLRFASDAPPLSRLNEWGVRFRSRWLRLPFGDQGFCLSRRTFDSLGGFVEDAAYGEDHLLVWKAHRLGVPVRSVGAPLQTSARKYWQHGWLQTTLLHLFLTVRQAIPQLVILLWSRVR